MHNSLKNISNTQNFIINEDTDHEFYVLLFVFCIFLSIMETWYETKIEMINYSLWNIFLKWPEELIECLTRVLIVAIPIRFFSEVFFSFSFIFRITILSTLVIIWTIGIELIKSFFFYMFSTSTYFQFTPNRHELVEDMFFFTLIIVSSAFIQSSYNRKKELKIKLIENNHKLIEEKSLRTESELKSLQQQINPHFLFNTLNSLYALVDSNPSEAKNLILHLSNLYRTVLGASKIKLWSIEEEIAFIMSYITIEKVRFSEHLEFRTCIDKSLDFVKIPPLIFQFIVENAVKHGISNYIYGGYIKINLSKMDSMVHFEVENAPFFPEKERETNQAPNINFMGSKTALINIENRLAKLYGSEYSFTCQFSSALSFVKVRLPGQPNL